MILKIDERIITVKDGIHTSKEDFNVSIAERDVENLRKQHKLQDVNPGDRYCLRCDNKFHSDDMKTIRMCWNCRKHQD